MCKHDQGFRFYPCTETEGTPGLWVCLACDQFALNFDPAKYPDGISYTQGPSEEKRVKVTHGEGKY